MSSQYDNPFNTINFKDKMKIWEIIGTIVGVGAIIQFIKWILDSIGITQSIGNVFTFFLSSIFTLLILIIISINQMYKQIKEIREFLNEGNLNLIRDKI